ncbi:MAG: sugar ABC transporter ATP-binding protein [Succinivibrio dextrinosolvens]|uniref:sugar ABC transporter ATP-binding protein n=1 Tax=Succinivibrio sp. TaxID=2053619 RepID=UPI0025DF84A7|nr:sugar ABC transporter ATP-binding protein [Succinivibrio sp.]MBQ3884374.1 sugar ABC transporter ATP-binding protein [Succinivibrio sp.]MBQ9220310.1 sugar ABC transporter ATP-binding protein [Succinivibrio sp.]MDY6466304.1 sugar ABC transporter ATP-binding protein [Succinivibrio dextrinosolvens]
MSENYVLELEHIRKEYPGVVALKDVTLRLRKGEVLGLIGENGAGKSTLIKCCTGAEIPTSGKIRVNGKEFDRMSPQLAAENGVAVIYQEFNNVGELSAAENLFLGRPIRKGMIIDRAAMEREAQKAFDQLHIKINPKELVKNLTVGYQQMIEIAKAIQQNAQVLIMDEPSAPLTSNEVENMFKVVELLRKKGVSIIYISHRLEEIFRLSDRIEVIRDGEYVTTLITPEATVDELIKLMVGRELTQKYPPRKSCVNKDKVVLELKNVTGNGDKDISLKLHAGEVLGLGGLVGAGRTELAEIIFGSKPKESGTIIFNGKEINPQSPREAIDLGIALVPEDRKRHGALLGISIKNNINMPIYERISKLSVINSKKEKEIAQKYREEIQIKCPTLNQLVKNLSGGNQQKVILGKWLAADCELIIFDEPTRGIDVGAKYEIYKLINELVESGRSVLMISSEMEELMGMSDRIIVLAENRTTGELQKDEFDSDKIMQYASGITDEAKESR